jgi:sulfoxide reductase heme-binding subunit YedZ
MIADGVVIRTLKPSFKMRWLDPAGRFYWLKAAVLLGAPLPGVFLGWQWKVGDLGAQPVMTAIDETGLWSIRFVVITLAVFLARRLVDWPRVTLLRRILGLSATAYVLAHLAGTLWTRSFK